MKRCPVGSHVNSVSGISGHAGRKNGEEILRSYSCLIWIPHSGRHEVNHQMTLTRFNEPEGKNHSSIVCGQPGMKAGERRVLTITDTVEISTSNLLLYCESREQTL